MSKSIEVVKTLENLKYALCATCGHRIYRGTVHICWDDEEQCIECGTRLTANNQSGVPHVCRSCTVDVEVLRILLERATVRLVEQRSIVAPLTRRYRTYWYIRFEVYSSSKPLLNQLVRAFGGKIGRHGKYLLRWFATKSHDLQVIAASLRPYMPEFADELLSYCSGDHTTTCERMLAKQGKKSVKLYSYLPEHEL